MTSLFTRKQKEQAEYLFHCKMENPAFAHYQDDEDLQFMLYQDCLNQFSNVDDLSNFNMSEVG